MSLRQRARNAWVAVREVVRAPSVGDMAAFENGFTYGFTYGTPSAERVSASFEQFSALAYGGNSVVFGVVNARLKLFSEARFKFRGLSDKRMFGDKSLSKLEKPWPGGSTGELLARMEQDVSLAGNAYIRDAGDWLERLRPDWVTIVSTVTTDQLGHQVREVIGYLYDPIGDAERDMDFYPVDEVAHWSPIPDPLASFRGMSWLSTVIKEINTDTAMTTHSEAYYRNAATPNLILKYANKLTVDQADRISSMVSARHAGPENSFRTMVLDQGADPMIVGSAMTGDGIGALQAAGENRIAVAAGVPSIVVGLKEGLGAATLANYDSAQQALANLTTRPNWRSACAALSKLIEIPPGAELWFDTSDIAALQDGEKDQADTFQVKAATASTLIQAGYTPESVTTAIEAGDLTLLKHSGLVSVQMHDANTTAPTPPATNAPTEVPA